MNLAGAREWLDAHQTPVMVAGGGVVAAVALWFRHKGSTADASGAAGATPTIAGLAGNPNTSATDEQNAVQDEINTQFGILQQQLTDALAKLKPPATTVPPPKPPPAAPPHTTPLPNPRPPATNNPKTGTSSSPLPKTYTVHAGDSLSAIARAHGMTLAQIEKLNPQYKANYNLIHTGDRVYV